MRPTLARLAALLGVGLCLAGCSVPAVSFTFVGADAGDAGSDASPVDTGSIDTSPDVVTARLTVLRTGAATGSVSADGAALVCADSCTAVVALGTSVTLNAAPDTGAVFGGWSGDACSSAGPRCTLSVTGDMTIDARFDVAMLTVGVTLAGTGGGTVASSPAGLLCPGACSVSVAYGTELELAAAPAVASTFVGWSGACSGVDRCRFTVTTDTAVTAAFAADQELAVASYNGHSISIFPNNASGNVAPIRTISGPATSLANPRGVAVVGNEIIAMDQGAAAVVVFDLHANGNVAPLRRIVGPTTGLNSPAGVVVFGGEIYVGQQNGVVAVFPLGANGDVAPTRAITGIGEAEDIAIVDGELYTPDAIGNRIVVFPANASGAATPSRVIAGPATGLATPVGLHIVNGEIVVGNDSGGRIAVFPQSASGNVAPLRSIAGPTTGLAQTLQITVFGGEIYVTSFNSNAVDVFPLNANGDVAPARRITGPATLIVGPAGVCVF